jgi:hypothetical protein
MRWRDVTFATPEDARRFIELLRRSRSGDPLLTLSGNGQHGGTWEDHLGLAAAVIEDNRLVWSRDPALALVVREGAVVLTLDGDILWQIRMARDGVTLEGVSHPPRSVH